MHPTTCTQPPIPNHLYPTNCAQPTQQRRCALCRHMQEGCGPSSKSAHPREIHPNPTCATIMCVLVHANGVHAMQSSWCQCSGIVDNLHHLVGSQMILRHQLSHRAMEPGIGIQIFALCMCSLSAKHVFNAMGHNEKQQRKSILHASLSQMA